jgi:hypothetical protein
MRSIAIGMNNWQGIMTHNEVYILFSLKANGICFFFSAVFSITFFAATRVFDEHDSLDR